MPFFQNPHPDLEVLKWMIYLPLEEFVGEARKRQTDF
jgi:hypothetical protein